MNGLTRRSTMTSDLEDGDLPGGTNRAWASLKCVQGITCARKGRPSLSAAGLRLIGRRQDTGDSDSTGLRVRPDKPLAHQRSKAGMGCRPRGPKTGKSYK